MAISWKVGLYVTRWTRRFPCAFHAARPQKHVEAPWDRKGAFTRARFCVSLSPSFFLYLPSPFSLLTRTYVPNDVSNVSNSLFVIHTFPNIIMKYMFYVTTFTLTVSEKKKNLLLSRRETYITKENAWWHSPVTTKCLDFYVSHSKSNPLDFNVSTRLRKMNIPKHEIILYLGDKIHSFIVRHHFTENNNCFWKLQCPTGITSFWQTADGNSTILDKEYTEGRRKKACVTISTYA